MNEGHEISSFRELKFETVSCAAKNLDGSFVINVINPNDEKRQYQLFYNDTWWYFDVMENSISTIVFEEN